MLLSIALLLLVLLLVIPLLTQHVRCRRRNARVFGIGYPRTGTSSLAHALRKLGYTTYHAPFASRFENIHNWAGQYEALTDLHTHVANFDALNLLSSYPDAKYVLTVRDPTRWIRSVHKSFDPLTLNVSDTVGLTQLRRLVDDLKSNSMDAHTRHVSEGFQRAGKSHQLLILDVSEPEAYNKLARFLGKGRRQGAFPRRDWKQVHLDQTIGSFFYFLFLKITSES